MQAATNGLLLCQEINSWLRSDERFYGFASRTVNIQLAVIAFEFMEIST